MKESTSPYIDTLVSLVTVSGIVIVDRITKIIFTKLLALGESLPVIPNIFHFTLVNNTGIAFGLFKDHGAVFIIITIVTIGLLIYNIYYYKKNEHLSLTYIVSFSLILGGAIGNLIDRIFIGHVVDFIDFRIWPVFNVADSAITVGAIFICLKCLTTKERK